MRCATHPDVETGLSCTRCGKAICPRCLVQTPVGARCSECAQANRLPTYVLRPLDFVKSISVGIITAVLYGIVWYLVRSVLPMMAFFNIIIAAGAGYGIGQLISRSVNRKRGVFLKVLAGISVVIAYAIGNQMMPGQFIFIPGLFDMIAIGIGIYIAVTRI